MNRFGASVPNCGCCQRTSASTPRSAPSSKPTSGWYSSTNSPRSTRRAQRRRRAPAGSSGGRCAPGRRASSGPCRRPSPSTASCRRPASARSGSVPAAVRSTTPMLAETDSRCPARSKGCCSAFRTRLGQVGELLGAGGVLDQQRELVAAEPRHQMAAGSPAARPGPRSCVSRCGHGGQQPVADPVAEGVVDGLEAVEVEVAQPDPAGAGRARTTRPPAPPRAARRTACGWAAGSPGRASADAAAAPGDRAGR